MLKVISYFADRIGREHKILLIFCNIFKKILDRIEIVCYDLIN